MSAEAITQSTTDKSKPWAWSDEGKRLSFFFKTDAFAECDGEFSGMSCSIEFHSDASDMPEAKLEQGVEEVRVNQLKMLSRMSGKSPNEFQLISLTQQEYEAAGYDDSEDDDEDDLEDDEGGEGEE